MKSTSAAKANRTADIVDRLEAENARLRAALVKARRQIEDVSAMPTDTDWIGRVLRVPPEQLTSEAKS